MHWHSHCCKADVAAMPWLALTMSSDTFDYSVLLEAYDTIVADSCSTINSIQIPEYELRPD